MNFFDRKKLLVIAVSTMCMVAACSSDVAENDNEEFVNDSSADPQSGEMPETSGSKALDTELFLEGAVEGDFEERECTLSGGTETTCYSITAVGLPSDYEVGPFCPSTTSATAEEGGIWFDGNGLYDIDGEFILGLAELYSDENWKLYDDDGNVNVTENKEEFEAAARPDVAEDLENHCVEGAVDYLENGEAVPYEVLIPATPVAASQVTTNRPQWGVTLNGVRIDGSAPVDAILSAYTIAAFDDCGGHFNPTEGYHMHGALDCSGVEVAGHADIFAYALDGYGIYKNSGDTDLDECGGHSSDDLGYHYHAAAPEENSVLGCLSGEYVDDGTAGGGRGQGGPPGR